MTEQRQEYRHGDLVEVVHLGVMMGHFRKGKAIVSNVSHNDSQIGNNWEWSYGLTFIDDDTYYIGNYSSWYHNSNLKMIKKGLAHDFKIKEITNE